MPYRKWLAVATLIYFPYVIINYAFTCPYSNMLLTNLFMFVILCFNVCFVQNNSEDEKHDDNTIKTPLLVKESQKTPTKVKKATPAKTSSKPSTGKKAPAKKKTPAKAPKLKPVTA